MSREFTEAFLIENGLLDEGQPTRQATERQYERCKNCGSEIVPRLEGGWVHRLGGETACHASTVAEPARPTQETDPK